MPPARSTRATPRSRPAPDAGHRTIEGGHDATGLRFGLVSSRYNPPHAETILQGALAVLRSRGARPDDLLVARVSGAWELPVVARKLASSGRFDAVIGLGVLIEGETAHFRLIGDAVARGLARAAEDSGVPVLFGLLTAFTAKQAADRAGGRYGNRGEEAALAAIEAARVVKGLEGL